MTDRGTSYEGEVPPFLRPAAPAERRVALVIGNAAYVNATPLRNPGNDAEAVSAVLTRLGFSVLAGKDVTRDSFEDLLGRFEEQIGGADVALLFFAGHGLQVKGHNYLIPVDADIRQEVHLKRRAFGLDELLEVMIRRARSSLVFLDACRDNPFARSLLSGMSTAEQGRYLVRSGLAEVKASQGSFIAFATSPDNVALDGAGSNSPFTEALIAHIEEPGQSVSDLMIEVRKQVLKTTGHKQEPWDQSSLRERFCFVPAEKTQPAPKIDTLSGPIDDRTLEHTFWQSVKDSGDPAELEEFLVKYPSGTFAGVAHERAKAAIEATSNSNALRRLMNRFPESTRFARMRARVATLAWAELAKAKTPAEAPLRAFLVEFADVAEATTARAALAKLLWPRLRKSESLADLQAFATDCEGTPEAASARKRIADLQSAESRRNSAKEAARLKSEKNGQGQKQSLVPSAGRWIMGLLGVALLVGGANLWRAYFPPAPLIELKPENPLSNALKCDAAKSPSACEGANCRWLAGSCKTLSEAMVLDPPTPSTTLSPPAKCEGVKTTVSGTTTCLKPKDTFQDCAGVCGPEMVVVPAGSFMMGSPEGEARRRSDEGPQRRVTIDQPFAVGKYEVTFAEWDACIAAGGCKTKAEDHGWGRGKRPVINVSWDDAKQYVSWLSKKTGQPYRLLTEAEWEYAARAGTTTRYSWGNTATHEQANYGKDECCDGLAQGRDQWVNTAPVGQFDANAFGLHDMHGNVWEWVEDCYASSYANAPVNGSKAPDTKECFRVLRGGSWNNDYLILRSAARSESQPVLRDYVRGFRLARTLLPPP